MVQKKEVEPMDSMDALGRSGVSSVVSSFSKEELERILDVVLNALWKPENKKEGGDDWASAGGSNVRAEIPSQTSLSLDELESVLNTLVGDLWKPDTQGNYFFN